MGLTRTIETYALPSHVEPEQLAGATVVVIDVIRASTTILHALAAGATEVRPFLEVEHARDAAKTLDAEEGRESYLLGGERDAIVIDGFDLGNSPSHYTSQRVAGKQVLFTTTNGTKAMMRCKAAKEVFIGAFVNVTAVAETLIDQERIVLLCAGTAGEASEDDLLLAGLLVEQLQERSGNDFSLDDQSRQVRATWQEVASDVKSPESLAGYLAKTRGGKNVVRAGLDADLLDVGTIDRFTIVPRLDTGSMRIKS